MEILCFVAGTLYFYKHSLYAFLFMIACILFRQKITIILAFIFAVFWSWLHDSSMYYELYSDKLDGKSLVIHGQVTSIPKVKSNKTQFILTSKNYSPILVNCYNNCANVKINQHIKSRIKLRKPHNYSNPGGFDYVEFLKARHISWLGSCNEVKILTENKDESNVRSLLKNKLETMALNQRTTALIQALTIGITNNLNETDWLLFRRTGTIHLLVISGAHIGFVAGFVFFVVNFLWSRFAKLSLLIPSVKIASFLAMFAALGYALLAGFSVSVQRALIACFLVYLRSFLHLKFSGWQAWRLGLLVCLIYEPHYILLPGFFLSFIAVAILFIANRYFLTANKFIKSLLLQIACLIGLLPFTLYWFGYASINGFFANLVAIPLVGFLIVPVSLIFLASSFWITSLWFNIFVTKLVDFLYIYLKFIDKNFDFNLDTNFSIYVTLSFVLIILISLIFPIKAFRFGAYGLLCALILPKSTKLPINEAQIDVLDVGQGLASLIRTKHHVLLYDTGGKFYHGKDLGELVIAPYLKTLKINKINMLVISHPDLDHRGGLATILKKFSIDKLVVNNPKYYKTGQNCHKFPEWNWDGVSFKFLSLQNKFIKTNDDSCVLYIKGRKTNILMTGDIERNAEKYLMDKYTINAEYLVVPHHGSRTSSSIEFIKHVNPKYAIFSYGHNNRYHFPAPEVMTRYENLQIQTFNTAEQGMITIKLK